MNKWFFLLLLGTSMLFSACDKGPRIDVPFRAYVNIPAGLNTGFSHHFILKDIPGITENKMIDAQPAYVTVTTEFGENTLDFIQQAYFYTRAEDGTLQEIAYQTNLPVANHSTIQLFPSILDMKPHITQDLFDMELKVIFRAIPITETRLRIDFGVQGVLEE